MVIVSVSVLAFFFSFSHHKLYLLRQILEQCLTVVIVWNLHTVFYGNPATL